jgi:hypothetical protein
MRGALLFESYQDNNNTLICRYVTVSAELFSTSVIDLLLGIYGAVPTIIEILGDVLNNVIQGITTGVFDAAQVEDVLANIPATLEQGLSLYTIAYLQGGTPQYQELASAYYLRSINTTPVTIMLLDTGLDSLSFFGCRAVTATYSRRLKMSDCTPIDGVLVKDVPGGTYKIYYPSAGSFNSYCEAVPSQTVAQISAVLQDTACLVSAISVLWGEEISPPEGHYLNPIADVVMSPGSYLNGVYYPPFLSSSGIQYSVPFTVTSPSNLTINNQGWEKVSITDYLRIRRNSATAPEYVYTGGGGGVTVKPSREYVSGMIKPSQVPATIAFGLAQWLLKGR